MSAIQAAPVARPEDELQNAVSQFRTVLTQDQQIELLSVNAIPDAESIVTYTAALDAENRGRKGRSVGSRVYNVLRSVRDFSEVVGIFVSSNPQTAALVWGSIRLTIQIILNYTSYYEAVCGLFMQIGQFCPVFDEYALLYVDCKPLQKSLSDFHASIVRCCKHIIEALNRPWLTQVFRAFSSSFDTEFQPDKENIRRCNENVKISIDLAKAQDDKRQLIAISEQSKENSVIVKALASKANVYTNKQYEIWKQQKRQEAHTRKKKILDTLCRYNPERLLKQNQRKRFGNTANWIFQTSEFRNWIDEKGYPLLWCLGKIGSGKSIVTSSVIDRLFLEKGHSKGPISYYFAHFSEPESLNSATVLRSLLKQRLPRKAMDLPDEIETRLEAIVSDHVPSLTSLPSDYSDLIDLVTLLSDVTPGSTRSYIVIDGFDEFVHSQQLVLFKAFSHLIKLNRSNKIFISCRASLKAQIPKYFLSPHQIILMEVGTKNDISAYIHGMVHQKIESGELRVGHDSLISEIIEARGRGADDMFLWVFFQLQEICAQPCDEDIRRTIADLPRDLEDIYTRILRRIAVRRASMPQKVFPWIAASMRPLTLYELREAIAVEIGQQYTKPERLCNDIDIMISTCENLLHVDEEDGSVRFAHHTIQTFLLQEPPGKDVQHLYIDLKEANHFLGEICLTYINFNDFKNALSQQPKEIYKSPDAVVQGMGPGPRKVVNLVQLIWPTKPSRAIAINQLFANRKGETQNTHAFFEYAETYWIFHSKDFERGKSKTYELWERIITQGCNSATPPLLYGFEDSNLLQFALDLRHYALIRLILSQGFLTSKPILKDYLLQSIKKDDMTMFDFLLPFQEP
ncbi:hypothetical protein F5B22DRAFT_224871 [Xylaria bambusicola]|uniref:uncharacterized protein n=1 Tax=Xylaria bambusicola TaxID=326684 RepID=UPI002007A04D|nr:uncharacterized protein F5B22DRAFT_224871 [Xylaria bambusicola]KAI0514613.1 hypothetical protein F5B22DRAFT_224871 [Xylaria bambusicola]